MHSTLLTDERKKQHSYCKKLCLPLLFTFLFFCLLTWVGYVYTKSEKTLNESLEKINTERDRIQSLIKETSSYMTLLNKVKKHALSYANLLENYAQKLKALEQQKWDSTNKGIVALTLCGKNNQSVKTKGGRPILNWRLVFNTSHINFIKDSIVISTPGIYLVYAQMSFFHNKSTFKRSIMDFYICKNRRDRLVLASVPVTTCPEVCTRSISSVVKLQKGDHLTVASYGDNIQFKMSPEKCQFSVLLLQRGSYY